ncbi:VQ motif-containing protein 9 [Raphanus sativus]|nr:VQ motif-containing protein 9 [Raphanus sativus]
MNKKTDHQSLLPPPPSQPHQHINHGNLHQHQPHPVYNINKNDFRDVVRKRTGSPTHERISAPPSQQPVHHPKAHQSSRLHRIRPPLVAHVVNRPSSGLLSGGSRDGDVLIPNWNGGYVPDL